MSFLPSPKSSVNGTHYISWLLVVVFVVVMAWEGYTYLDGKPETTISASMRALNDATGGLLALFTLALWIHFFWRITWASNDGARKSLALPPVRRRLVSPSTASSG